MQLVPAVGSAAAATSVCGARSVVQVRAGHPADATRPFVAPLMCSTHAPGLRNVCPCTHIAARAATRTEHLHGEDAAAPAAFPARIVQPQPGCRMGHCAALAQWLPQPASMRLRLCACMLNIMCPTSRATNVVHPFRMLSQCPSAGSCAASCKTQWPSNTRTFLQTQACFECTCLLTVSDIAVHDAPPGTAGHCPATRRR